MKNTSLLLFFVLGIFVGAITINIYDKVHFSQKCIEYTNSRDHSTENALLFFNPSLFTFNVVNKENRNNQGMFPSSSFTIQLVFNTQEECENTSENIKNYFYSNGYSFVRTFGKSGQMIIQSDAIPAGHITLITQENLDNQSLDLPYNPGPQNF